MDYHQKTKTKNKSSGKKVLTFYVFGSRTLYKGCEGTDVLELQYLLIKLGYKISESGYFDDETESAVKNFQTQNELTADGIIGSVTLSKIENK